MALVKTGAVERTYHIPYPGSLLSGAHSPGALQEWRVVEALWHSMCED